ncbi:MAG: histone deacetylase [Planctomycetes bacterium]|nr:histone deacetylase [Planctomycetota bacterium]
MTLLYYDPRFLDHLTGKHPERPERLVQTIRHLERTGLLARCGRPQFSAASLARLYAVHSAEYVDGVHRFATAGGGRIEEDTVVSPHSFDVAALAAGAACDAVERVVRGEDKTAFCLVRPPGHHALRNQAMGFCLFNIVAIAARLAVDELQLSRVLIVDWDVHHGNGTQAIFWEDPQVGYFSIHRWPFYPGTGRADDIGGGAGEGATRNVPIEFGTPRATQLENFRTELFDFAAMIQPQLVLISTGFDSHTDDPIGSLGWETEDFATVTNDVQEVANRYAAGRIVSILEGGYNCGVLAGCVEAHLDKLLNTEVRSTPRP